MIIFTNFKFSNQKYFYTTHFSYPQYLCTCHNVYTQPKRIKKTPWRETFQNLPSFGIATLQVYCYLHLYDLHSKQAMLSQNSVCKIKKQISNRNILSIQKYNSSLSQERCPENLTISNIPKSQILILLYNHLPLFE